MKAVQASNPIADKPAQTTAGTVKVEVYLEAPFNLAHPSSRCAMRKLSSGQQGRHKFKTTSRNLIRTGVYATIMTCANCGSKVRVTEDYTVLAGIF